MQACSLVLRVFYESMFLAIADDVLIVQESMKMELRLAAPCDGIVATLACAEGDMVERHGLLAEVQPQDAPQAAP